MQAKEELVLQIGVLETALKRYRLELEGLKKSEEPSPKPLPANGNGTKPQGKMSNAKLAADSIPKIRTLLGLGFPFRKVAELFGVSIGAIQAIADKRTWKHVT